MDRRTFLLSGTALVSALASRAQNQGSKLTVQVTYTGSGTVDESHKVYVALWDTPDFMKDNDSSQPIALQGITSKSAVAQFDDIQKNPVYVSMVYDPAGKWEATSAPPAGSSLGLYANEPGTPTPIQLQPGKTTKISAKFDDSFKMK
jgi:uncharacterized protein (DUF2141 family)